MITIEQRDHLINAGVLGEFTLEDFKQFEEAVLLRMKFEQRVDLLLDLRDMTAFTIDVAWEEIKFSRRHPTELRKIAIVTDDQWITWSAWLSRAFVAADVQVFEDYDVALEWVAAE